MMPASMSVHVVMYLNGETRGLCLLSQRAVTANRTGMICAGVEHCLLRLLKFHDPMYAAGQFWGLITLVQVRHCHVVC